MTKTSFEPQTEDSLHRVLLQWLVAAALFDWLVTRTITRSAIFMPKPPLVLLVYQVLGWVGQLALALASLLALSTLVWIAWNEWCNRRSLGLPLLLFSQAIFSLIFLFIAPIGGLAVADHLFYLATVIFILLRAIHSLKKSPNGTSAQRFAALLPILAVLVGRLHQAIPAIYATWQLPGPPPLAGLLFNLGELLVVVSGIVFWWAYGQRVSWAIRLGAAILTVAFAGAHFNNAAMTGILAIWSLGLTLYLPWLLYALSLWGAIVTVLAIWRRGGQPVSWAILLLFASGYTPQLSIQALLSLIALWLLVTPYDEPNSETVTSAVLRLQMQTD